MQQKERDFGFELIKELKRRKLWGSFLTYNQYCELKQLHSADEVHYFLHKAGFNMLYSDNPSSMVSRLEKAHYQKQASAGDTFTMISAFLQFIQWILLCVFH